MIINETKKKERKERQRRDESIIKHLEIIGSMVLVATAAAAKNNDFNTSNDIVCSVLFGFMVCVSGAHFFLESIRKVVCSGRCCFSCFSSRVVIKP